MKFRPKLIFLIFISFVAISLIKVSTAKREIVAPTSHVLKVNFPEKDDLLDLFDNEFATEVFFSEGKDLLSLQTRKNIIHNYYLAHKQGKVIGAKIFSWGDQIKNLRIVERRNDKLEAIIEEVDLALPVKKYNLSEAADILFRSVSGQDKLLLESLKEKNEFKSRSIVYFEVE